MKKPIPSWFTGWLVSLFVVRSKIHQEYRWYASKTPYKVSPINSINRSTIWLFNIAMENPWTKWRFLAGKIFDKWAIYTMAMLVITRGYLKDGSTQPTPPAPWNFLRSSRTFCVLGVVAGVGAGRSKGCSKTSGNWTGNPRCVDWTKNHEV